MGVCEVGRGKKEIMFGGNLTALKIAIPGNLQRMGAPTSTQNTIILTMATHPQLLETLSPNPYIWHRQPL